MGHRWRHSVRWRLVTLFVLLALATTGAFVVGSQRVLQAGWQGFARPLVTDYVDRLVAEIGSPPDVARAAAIARRLPLSVRIDGPRVQYDSHPDRPEHRAWSDPWRPRTADGERLLVRQTADGHRIQFGVGDAAAGSRPRFFGWITLVVLLGLTAVAYAGVRRLLAPLDDIGAGAQAFGAADFAHEIPVRRRDELGDLAQRINAMARNLHGMLEAKRTLLLAISHELRSPLTRARLNAELLDDSPTRAALLRDLGEMRDLIADLLESERLQNGHAALHREPIEPHSWIPAQLEAIGGTPRPVLEQPLPEGQLHADATRLKLLLRNLVHNAQRHGQAADGRAPVVSLARQPAGDGAAGEVWKITVRDFGPGVTTEQLAQLAEPFYRTDTARQRQTGGVGLGLHLCQQIAQAHGGSLGIERAEPGLRVTARIPAA